jgi:hypothetical protein
MPTQMLARTSRLAALALILGGCTPDAPRLGAPRKEMPAAQAPAPPLAQAPAPPPVVPAANVLAAPPIRAAPVREKLGAGQCRSCHRIQYDSWVKSGHARKALDCEGCHGNGSEYATLEVMKDLARAKANGLIFQTAAFCEKCHPTADASYLPRAHAHGKKK